MQLQDYALGHMESKTNLGYVKKGCGTSATTTYFTVTGKRSTFILIFDALAISGLFCQILFVWIVSAVLMKTAFKEYAQRTFTSSYDVYGMFWGVSTTAALIMAVLHSVYVTTARAYFLEKKMSGWLYMYPLLVTFAPVFTAAIELAVALYIASRAVVAVPSIFKYPATLLCCGRKRRAMFFLTAIVLWVDMVALQLVLFQVAVIAFTISIYSTFCNIHQCDAGCASSFLPCQHLLAALHHICPHLHSCRPAGALQFNGASCSCCAASVTHDHVL